VANASSARQRLGAKKLANDTDAALASYVTLPPPGLLMAKSLKVFPAA
jgi:hypothetical protein